MNKKMSIASTILAGVVLCGALVYYNFVDKKLEGVGLGAICPDFTVDTMAANNGEFSFTEEEYGLYAQNGKVRVINFWATWCSGCKHELPYFDQFAKEYPEVDVIAICGESGTKDVVTQWMNNEKSESQTNGWASYSLTFGYYGQTDENVYYALGGTGMLPMTVVVDEKSVIRYTAEKELDYEELKEIVLPLLND